MLGDLKSPMEKEQESLYYDAVRLGFMVKATQAF